ncbi:MAG: hypothetical protein GF350_09770 [Chitinivibrionales bacterium]|nr:hypothetical protein [Chitinivibrionales bacterium]
MYKYTSASKYAEDWDLKLLYGELQMAFGATYQIPEDQLSSITHEKLFDEIWSEVKSRYEEKETRFGASQMRQFERGVFLMVIDSLWKDHLYEMDHLKQGVQFRAFGQKNPLYEYQREALKAFDELRSAISREVASHLFRLETVRQEEDRMGLDHSRTAHADFDVFSSAQARQPQQAAAGRGGAQLITNRAGSEKKMPMRVGKQVGRNDPCPCGSGKKYKKCCGKA